MIKGRIVNFSAPKMEADMMKIVVAEQNYRLIEYAKRKIIKIGNSIREYHSRNGMDRTGNLLESLLWGVSYDGKLVEGGFFGEAGATRTSYLHEWMSGDVKYLIPVNGRQLAEGYLQQFGNSGSGRWRVFFAILAPYWGYWEKGFRMNSGFQPKGAGRAYARGVRSFYRFAVMAQFYDEVKPELKPARVRYRVSVPKYERAKLEKRWRKYAGF